MTSERIVTSQKGLKDQYAGFQEYVHTYEEPVEYAEGKPAVAVGLRKDEKKVMYESVHLEEPKGMNSVRQINKVGAGLGSQTLPYLPTKVEQVVKPVLKNGEEKQQRKANGKLSKKDKPVLKRAKKPKYTETNHSMQ